ncbi:MAG TPA: HAMP domain-containing sensor histidine kinase [Puia sp.]|nr:HAMP domain-containing sensor histidine kinase [Puia sp.]
MKWSYAISFAAGIVFFTLLTWSIWWLVGGAIVFLGVWVYQFIAERRYIHEVRTATLEKQLQELQSRLDNSVRNERQLARTAEQAVTARRQLLASMNQEIRTPVNGMIGMASLLTETQLNDQQREYINGILHCGEQLVAVVNHIVVDDIVNTSLISGENGNPKEELLDLRSCIQQVVDKYAERIPQDGPVLSCQVDEKIPERLAGDGGRLKQILSNLVDNAVKHASRGEITILARLVKKWDDGRLELGFEVRDTGNGIPASVIGRLFKGLPEPNSGFGLVVCRRLVEMMDGTIGVQSEPGKGCVFSFNVFVNTAGSPPARPATSAQTSGAQPAVQDKTTGLALNV